MINENDQRNRRCPKLGHEVSFKYCREPGSSLPCNKIADCWFETFDIVTYLKENYNEEKLKEMVKVSKPKTLSLIELIEQAKKSSRGD